MARQASNKLELSRRLIDTSNTPRIVKLKPSVTNINDTISMECNKPLQSRCYVVANSKPRFEWGYNSDRRYGVYRAIGNLWLCRDRQVTELSECEKEQWRLYRQLKREYDLEQKLLQDKTVSETTVTNEDKLRARVRHTAYLLNKEQWDNIYGIKNCIK